MSVTIRSIAYAFPSSTPSVRELAEAGLLASEPELLEGFGFGRIHAACDETPYELAALAAGRALDRAGVDPASIDVLIHGGIDGATAFVPSPSAADSRAAHRTTARFRYPATRLQHELGLERAQVLGVGQLACTTLFGAVRLARALILSEGVRRVLCVAADFFPADAGREAIYNCTSDAAVAVLVERGGDRRALRSVHHVTKGYYWDPDALRNEMVAAYFPTARHVIERAVADAGWSIGDVDWVMPHNVGERSWRILASLSGLGDARVWTDNIARDGHTLAGDNFINLADALDAGALADGQRVLLFSFGYGAHWTAIALEA
ncbi:MAG TPA: 3-oxoacyl-[acyl-carrier-protein] synthase III C-terminal domain-containing protein [Longimicrobiales bacterium]